MEFESLEDEVRFLRALVRVTRVADEVLEDCLDHRLGLSAALDVFLAQAIRMVPARAGFAQVQGTRGTVLCRMAGRMVLDVEEAARLEGMVAVEGGRLYVRPLTLGRTRIGALGLLLQGAAGDERVMALVEAMAEQLDSALLGFMALADGNSPLERLDELNESLHFLPSARIGRYELVCPLGAGGMAQVMVARTLGPQGVSRLVALKRILPHLCGDKEMVDQFLDEARLGLRLAHPNLITVYDFGQTATGYYLAMELVRGVDLHDLVYSAGGPLPPKVASAVVAQALCGLHAAHEARGEDGTALELVHRDLSPSNVMVGFDGRVKVMDFGIAKLRVQRAVTQPGMVKGKPAYMAPEQAVNDPLDRRADLFAMGLILHEVLTGARPFQREDDGATMDAIVSDPLPARDDVSAPLWEVLERALEKDPARRFQTAEEMAQALVRAEPPAAEEEVGRLIAVRCPDRLRKVSEWDRPPEEDVSRQPTRARPARRAP